MANPKVFVSSTYMDLKDIRLSLQQFITSRDFDPVLFEKGNVTFNMNSFIDLDCYDEIKSCDILILIIGGRYGSRSSSEIIKKTIRKGSNYSDDQTTIKKFNSITKLEYITAKNAGLLIHVFVDHNVRSEYDTYKRNEKSSSRNMVKYAHVDNTNIFHLLDDIFSEDNTYVTSFNSAEDIINHLRMQWVGIFKRTIDRRKEEKLKSSKTIRIIRINSYKLFYHRKKANLTITSLAALTGISKNLLEKYEKIDSKENSLSKELFPICDQSDLMKLEGLLKIEQDGLRVGSEEDFLSQYMLYYDVYKLNKFNNNLQKNPVKEIPFFNIKAVVFEFDGTLIIDNNIKTTWEKLWQECGYPLEECVDLHRQFTNGKISHKDWCKLTLEKFKERNLAQKQVLSVASNMKLISGFRNTIEHLHNKGVKLYILSGSIDVIIKEALGDLKDYFNDISSNKFHFDESGLISEIIGTKYDFKTKATYLSELSQQLEISPYEILFVGNSCNDVWAYQSGVQTLCIQAHLTDPNNSKQWTHFIRDIQDLFEIVKLYRSDKTRVANLVNVILG